MQSEIALALTLEESEDTPQELLLLGSMVVDTGVSWDSSKLSRLNGWSAGHINDNGGIAEQLYSQNDSSVYTPAVIIR